MYRAAGRRKALAEAAIADLPEGGKRLQQAREALERLERAFEGTQVNIHAAASRRGISTLGDTDSDVQAIIERDLPGILQQELTAEQRALLVPRAVSLTTSEGAATAGAWPELRKHWERLERAIEARDDLMTWVKVFEALEHAAPTSERPTAE